MTSVFLANAETWAGGAHLFFSFWLCQMITLSPAMLLSVQKIGFLLGEMQMMMVSASEGLHND